MKQDCVVFVGFELVGRITMILYVDEISCGLRWYAFKIKNANLTTANPMLAMQRKKSSPGKPEA